jgi:hypothetical protein
MRLSSLTPAATLSLFVLTLPSFGAALAEEIVFTVGGDKAAGKAAAQSGRGKWVSQPSKAFRLAAAAIQDGGDVDVIVRIAEGEYGGDLGSGAYTLPSLRGSEATFTIEGGWSASFESREPFRTPTTFVTNRGRSQPMLKFRPSTPADQDELEAMTLDGIFFDAGESNNYDSETNSLLKRGSCTHVQIHFGYLRTDALVIQNCGFLNTAHRAFETLIRCASDETEIRIENNLFLNNLIPVKLDTARYRHKAKRMVVRGNSFLMNWALNPDPDTSNPGALELGSVDGTSEILLERNLFYANFGGAILALPKRLPSLTLVDNNFVGNGLLHGDPAPDAVSMIVEVNHRKMPLPLDLLEEVMAVEEAVGNVSIAPGLPLALGEVQTVDASAIKPKEGWENEVRRMLGQNLDGGTVAISGFAPRKNYDPSRPPIPTNESARGYGIQFEVATVGAQ